MKGANNTPHLLETTTENILFTHQINGDRVVLMFIDEDNSKNVGFQEQETHVKTCFTNDSPLLPLIKVNGDDTVNG